MFADTESCPYIFSSKWVSHEDNCATAYHNCITCKHCIANINYWGAVDAILQSTEPPAINPPDPNPYELNQLEIHEMNTNATRRSRQSKRQSKPSAHWEPGMILRR